mmetsp:Transcript_82866/g.268511  ORF Transcript_82866/g.268511 Transcript_82866/m.268511 type:complete len:200 (-) Transcript_82866:238-837(-)
MAQAAPPQCSMHLHGCVLHDAGGVEAVVFTGVDVPHTSVLDGPGAVLLDLHWEHRPAIGTLEADLHSAGAPFQLGPGALPGRVWIQDSVICHEGRLLLYHDVRGICHVAHRQHEARAHRSPTYDQRHADDVNQREDDQPRRHETAPTSEGLESERRSSELWGIGQPAEEDHINVADDEDPDPRIEQDAAPYGVHEAKLL